MVFVPVVRTRPPLERALPAFETAPAVVEPYLRDAAHFPGGRAAAVVRPADVDEVAAVVRHAAHVLPVGARSSLTGGATPAGDVVLSTERLTTLARAGLRVRAGAGLTLDALQRELAADNLWFPPVPTFPGATVGGAVSTNAAGAATFKYGSMREWVDGLTVVLSTGDILSLARGEAMASPDGSFAIETSAGLLRVQIPGYVMPDVPKRSAGYFAAPGMDLVDLFIGAEGTLGVIVDATLRVAPHPAGLCLVLVPLPAEEAAIRLVGELRRAARRTWQTGDPRGVDLSAIEHMDRRSLDVVIEDGVADRLHISIDPGSDVLLLMQLELSAAAMRRDLWGDLADARSPSAPDTPLTELCRVLDRHDALDRAEVALPQDKARAAAFGELREAVPAGVNRRVALAQARGDRRISKIAGDMIVPFDGLAEMMRRCRALFAARDLDLAVWGHISDGNVHPNVLPRSYADVERGREALLALGEEVISLGGCPLAEHGVGRNPVKQRLLRMLYEEEGVEAMRAVKRSLDPDWKLASGVLF